MTISLSPDQQDWILQHVERGEFASVDEAARQLIAERIAERELEVDDLAWAKPLVDEALAEVASGDAISAEAFRRHVALVLTRLAG